MLLLADVVYDPEGYEPLLLTLHAALQPAHWQALPESSPVAIMAHRSRHPDQHVRTLRRQQRRRCRVLQRAFPRKYQLHAQLFFDRLFAEFKCGSCASERVMALSHQLAHASPSHSVRQFQAAEVRRLVHPAPIRFSLLCAVVPLSICCLQHTLFATGTSALLHHTRYRHVRDHSPRLTAACFHAPFSHSTCTLQPQQHYSWTTPHYNGPTAW